MAFSADQGDLDLVAVNIDILCQQHIGLNDVVGVESCRQQKSLIRMQYFAFVIEAQILPERL